MGVKKPVSKAAQRKVGRPRKYKTNAQKIETWRKKINEKRRTELYLSSSAGWRLKALTDAWGLTRSQTIERLLHEADDRYKDILFEPD